MFKFEKTILIEKTPREVYKYISNPSNTPNWRTDVVETKFKSLPLQVGDKIEEIINFVGQQKCVVEVVEAVPDQRIAFKVISGPTYLPLRWLSLEADEQNTKLTAGISVHTDGLSRLIEPISSNMFSIKWETYLFQLKRVLEELKD
jgi:uncharacterized protein YndB with AHSA1/START domain